jgi:transposase InsO family protein
MSRKGNCWDNAPQESFFGRMKDHIKGKLEKCTSYEEVHKVRFMARNGRHSVLERPLYGAKRPQVSY